MASTHKLLSSRKDVNKIDLKVSGNVSRRSIGGNILIKTFRGRYAIDDLYFIKLDRYKSIKLGLKNQPELIFRFTVIFSLISGTIINSSALNTLFMTMLPITPL